MKKTFGLAAVAVLTLALGACGDDSGDSGGGYDEAAYCEAYKSAQSEFEDADFAQFDSDTFADLQGKITDMREMAPPELVEDWETFEGALTEFESILEGAGLTVDDLSGLESGELPEGVDMAQLEKLGTEMQEFADSSDIEAATDAIEKDAETRCDVPAEGGES